MEKAQKKFQNILKNIENLKEKQLLEKAYNFSKKAHKWQKRKSWDEYFIHPLEVAISLWNKFQDLDLIIAWLLHDTVEDNEKIKISEIYKIFWNEVWFLVDSVTKNEDTFFWEDLIFEKKIDKIIFWWFQNIKCFLLKIADREDNLKTLHKLKDNKQVRIAFETQAIFKPLSDIIFEKEKKSISKIKNNFNNFLKKEEIKNYLKLKEFLIKDSFNNFTEWTFDSIYDNPSSVSWVCKDESLFMDLLKKDDFSKNVDLKSLLYTEKWLLEIKFRFTKWEIPNKKELKLETWDVYYFN